MNALLTEDQITTEDVLGQLIWRLKNPDSVPPRILCLSDEARARNRELARQICEQVMRDEAVAKDMRAHGVPTAFFSEPNRRG